MNVDPEARAHRQVVTLASQGHWQLAENACRQLLQVRPDRADSLSLLGVIYLRTARSAQAVEPLRRALELQHRQPLVHALLGDALLELGRPGDALTSYEKALQQDARLVPALFGRANALLDLKQFEVARSAYERVLQQAPDYAEAWYNRGNALLALKQPALAAESFERAIRIRPGYALAYNNRGKGLTELKQLDGALASFEAAIAADDTLTEARSNRNKTLFAIGETLVVQGGRHEEAVARLTELLRIDADFEYGAGALHHAQRWCADWTYPVPGIEPEDLRLAVLAGRRVSQPFAFLSIADDPRAQLRCAQIHVESAIDRGLCPSPHERHKHDRIRVAYVSGDFRRHVVSYLLAGVLEKHDRQRFETIGISLAPEDPSPLGQRMKAAFDRFVDVSALSDAAAAQLMRGLEIDIAVDLAGHTSQRFNIFAHRPAPVQVQYLGYPGTLGAPFVDYLLADSFIVPPAQASSYAEKIVYLPDCFQANGDLRASSNPTPSREQVGLDPGAFVFCCFNNVYKINSQVFDVWMRLLTRIPDSVLWLFAPNEAAARNLRLEARRRDVDPDRLVFAPRVPYEGHLARLGLADLFLDTLPFNGGATASDALWSGTPLLTCVGRSFAGRMAGSLLQAVGLVELIAEDWEEYERKALELAQRPELLAGIRARLTEARTSSPLFDNARFCSNLERAYEEMWRRHERGERPANFTVPRL